MWRRAVTPFTLDLCTRRRCEVNFTFRHFSTAKKKNLLIGRLGRPEERNLSLIPVFFLFSEFLLLFFLCTFSVLLSLSCPGLLLILYSKKKIHASGGIRTRNNSKRAANGIGSSRSGHFTILKSAYQDSNPGPSSLLPIRHPGFS
jgi:hypothetical protein